MLNVTPQFIELEQLASESEGIDYEQILYQTLVNDGKHIKVLNAKRPIFYFNEKDLRDSAAAEVAQTTSLGSEESGEKGNRKRKQLSADEKAKQNRDRNREHAKNTRLRKKAYVSKLKNLVEHLHQQKELDEKERKILGERIYDTHVIRKNAVRIMLSYRAANIQDRDKWAAILEENFIFYLPITPYRNFHKSDIVNSGRVLVGIDAAIADTASLGLMVETIGQGTPAWKDAIRNGTTCRLTYSCEKEDMTAAGDLIMCKYLMRIQGGGGSEGSVGSVAECIQHGMLQCKFNRQNKMVSAEITYDVMGFMQQLQRASNLCAENSIIPNTLSLALQPSKEARAIISAEKQFKVVHINDAWSCLKNPSHIELESTSFIQMMSLSSSEEASLEKALEQASLGRAGSILLHDINDESILYYIKILPLSDDSNQITHLLATLFDIPNSSTE